MLKAKKKKIELMQLGIKKLQGQEFYSSVAFVKLFEIEHFTYNNKLLINPLAGDSSGKYWPRSFLYPDFA